MQVVVRAIISYVAQKHASTDGHGNLLHEHILNLSSCVKRLIPQEIPLLNFHILVRTK